MPGVRQGVTKHAVGSWHSAEFCGSSRHLLFEKKIVLKLGPLAPCTAPLAPALLHLLHLLLHLLHLPLHLLPALLLGIRE
jgi:hypothetical protein